MIKEFKEFISKGNVIDLAVAVIIGAAFAGIVKAFTDGILMPLIGALGGKQSFDEYTLNLNGSLIRWGSFVTAVVNFLIVAVALFLIVKAVNRMQSVRNTVEEAEDVKVTEVMLLTEIRDLLVDPAHPAQPDEPSTSVG